MLALSPVPQGCANFYIDEPMYQASREIVRAIPEDEQTALAERYQPATKGLRPLITERIAEMGVVGEPRAVLMEEGDLIICAQAPASAVSPSYLDLLLVTLC